MPAPTFTPGDEKQGDQLNPHQQDYDRRFNDAQSSRPEYPDVEKGLQDLENFSKGNAADVDKSISEREQEPASGYANNYTGSKNTKTKGKFNWRNKSALTSILIVLLGGGGLLGTLFAPGIGIVQMKEMLTSNLNDQLAAMDIRGDAVFKAKLKGMSSGVCTGAVQIKCKFTSMSKKQVERFKSAGFVIPEDGVDNTAFGRQRITKMTAPDGTEIRNPSDLASARRTSPQTRTALKRVFNPVYYGLSDKVAVNFLGKNKVDKAKKITGATDEERRTALTEATAGEKANSGVLSDAKGQYMLDEDGTRVYSTGDDANPERFNELKDAADGKVNILNGLAEGGKATAKVLGGALKGVSVLGAADSACTVYNTARAVSAAAKVARSMQLIQFAMIVLNTADSIKAGDATPEEVNFIGTMLTSTDSRQKVPSDADPNVEIDNPFYQKSAFDSPGYKTAAFNDAPIFTARSQQYMVGGGLSGTLSGTITTVEQMLGGGSPSALREGCGIIQSPWVRGVGLIAGIFTAIGSFGVGTAVSIGASLLVSMALPFLEAMLADIVAGQVISPTIAGVDAGDATFAGTGALLGGVAQARGMTPLSKDGIQSYIAATSETNQAIIASEKYEASKTPLDATNQYSFLGSFASSLYPTAVQAKSGATGALTSVASILTQGFASLTKNTSAVQEYNDERFSRCNDEGYEELDIAADVFCNVRYGFTEAELAMDSEAVVDFMVANKYVTSSGDAQGTYKDFIERCAQRDDGWGEVGQEGANNGSDCLDGTTPWGDAISYFRIYTMDKSISDAMDDEEQTAGSTGLTGRPDGAVDKGQGWVLADNVDYSQYECDPRTEDAGPFTNATYGFTVRLCVISFNTPTTWSEDGGNSVASVVSTNVMNMFEAARADGVELGLSDGMRKTSAASYSNHKFGLALDLGTPRGGQTICYGGNPATGYGSAANAEAACRGRGGAHYQAYQWLQANAANYGFFNLTTEPWHWDTVGG